MFSQFPTQAESYLTLLARLKTLKFPTTLIEASGPQAVIRDLHNKRAKISSLSESDLQNLLAYVHDLKDRIVALMEYAKSKNTSFMCQSGLHRSYFLTEISKLFGVPLVENIHPNIWGRNKFGISVTRGVIDSGMKSKDDFVRVEGQNVYLGENVEPTQLLVVAFDPIGRGELDFPFLVNLLSKIPEGAKFELVFIICMETMIELVSWLCGLDVEEFDDKGRDLVEKLQRLNQSEN